VVEAGVSRGLTNVLKKGGRRPSGWERAWHMVHLGLGTVMDEVAEGLWQKGRLGSWAVVD
jgi:hypothetical protein